MLLERAAKLHTTFAALSGTLTCFSAGLPRSQINHRGSEGPSLSHPATTVSNHTAGVAHQLDKLLKGNVLHRPEVGVLLNTLLSHHTHHFLTSCLQRYKDICELCRLNPEDGRVLLIRE